MTNNLLKLVAVAALALGLPASLSAAEPATGAGAPITEAEVSAPKAIPYHGDVAAVDPAAKTFTFRSKEGKERVFNVAEQTSILNAGAKADFSAITAGSYATGQYHKAADGKLEAISVKIGPKPEKKDAK